MKALTLWQPWATLVALGAKRIETRSWATKHRGPIAIHAAARPHEPFRVGHGTRTVYQTLAGGQLYTPDDPKVELPRGTVVATATLVDCVPIHEDICKCEERGDPWLEYIQWRRKLLNLYTRQPHKVSAPSGIMVGDVLSGATAITRVNRNSHLTAWTGIDRSDGATEDLPFGDFRCGRWAWLLNDVEALDEPVPAKGRQGLWNWENDS